mgnify:CR=1 FL=1
MLDLGRRGRGSRPGLLELVSLLRQRAADVHTKLVRAVFFLLFFLGRLSCLVRWGAHRLGLRRLGVF